MNDFGISNRDIAQVYVLPHPYNNAFEEEMELKYFDTNHPAGGLQFKTFNGQLTIGNMIAGTLAAKIPNWRSRIRGAWLVEINGTPISTLTDVHTALDHAVTNRDKTCHLLFAHPEIQHGLTNDGIPQINIDQMNPRLKFSDFPMPHVPEVLKPQVKALWNMENSGVHEYINGMCRKLTRGKLLKTPTLSYLPW